MVITEDPIDDSTIKCVFDLEDYDKLVRFGQSNKLIHNRFIKLIINMTLWKTQNAARVIQKIYTTYPICYFNVKDYLWRPGGRLHSDRSILQHLKIKESLSWSIHHLNWAINHLSWSIHHLSWSIHTRG